jgi:hypothetical protein
MTNATDDTVRQTPANLPLDGLCLIGKVASVDQVKSNATGLVIDNLANLTVETTRGPVRVTISKFSRELTGDVALPAFNKLIYGEGKQWIISVGISRDRDESRYVNYTAIDAFEL